MDVNFCVFEALQLDLVKPAMNIRTPVGLANYQMFLGKTCGRAVQRCVTQCEHGGAL